ncbi:MAG: hypothetical protein R2738_02230 [Bacteroides graminisolvens]
MDNTTENIRIVYFERDIARENEAYEFLKASGLKQGKRQAICSQEHPFQ